MTSAVLLYSKHCPHSAALLNHMKDSPPDPEAVRFVCVDGMLDRLPPEVDRTPALIMGRRAVYGSELRACLGQILQRKSNPDPEACDSVSEFGFSSIAAAENEDGEKSFGGLAGATEDVRISYQEEGGSEHSSRRSGDGNELQGKVDLFLNMRAADLAAMASTGPPAI